ncbi:Nif3-like dinuclear metal center hexameric protein [Bifidobacterium aquikefiricola]
MERTKGTTLDISQTDSDEQPILGQVVEILESLYPLEYAESWDAPGLIVGDLSRRITRVMFAVDPTIDVVDEAIRHHADLLITHHPLLFRAVHEVSGLGFRGGIINALVRNNCALWVGHTNADVAYRGVAHSAADALGLVNLHPLIPSGTKQHGHDIGLGRVGTLSKPQTLRNFASVIANKLPRTKAGVLVCGELDAVVHTVAILPGSGDSCFDEVRDTDADVYVTSDLRHHPVTDAYQQSRYEFMLKSSGYVSGGEHHAAPSPAFINTPHSAIEHLWLAYAAADLQEALKKHHRHSITSYMSTLNTDPWSLRL